MAVGVAVGIVATLVWALAWGIDESCLEIDWRKEVYQNGAPFGQTSNDAY
jgi:hypothetical protein